MTIRQTGGCLALTVALACAASAQSGVQGDKQFQGALQKEMVDGDLKAAIEEYRKVSTRPGVGRELAATSLVRMGECYQKLGDGQARRILGNPALSARLLKPEELFAHVGLRRAVERLSTALSARVAADGKRRGPSPIAPLED